LSNQARPATLWMPTAAEDAMKILLRTVTIELDRKARAEVESRLREGLDPLAHRIMRVKLRVVDHNGPRGGADISCDVDVRLRPRGRLFILETDDDPLGAVNKAVNAAVIAVTRRLQRSRDGIRRGTTRRFSEALERRYPADQPLA
jgi:putative sigma-54 modulation protein